MSPRLVSSWSGAGPMTKGVSTRLIPLSDIAPEQLAAWRRLAAHAAEPNPFFEPDYVLATARRTGDSGHLLVVEGGAGWLACLPVRRRGAPGFRALRSWCDEYCFLGTPLVDRESVDEAVEALLGPSAEGHRLLVLERFALDGPIGTRTAQLLHAGRVERVLERRYERAIVTRQPEQREFDLRRGVRRERTRKLEGLARAIASPVELRERPDSDAAIEDFLQLEAASWKGGTGTALASRPADAAFFREVCSAFADAGRFSMLELSGDHGLPLAMLVSFTAGDALFAYKTAFDEGFKSYAPGVEVTYATVERFFEDGRGRLLDSCAASENALLNRMLPDRRRLATLIVGPASARTAFARQAARAAVTLRERRRAADAAA